MAGCSVPLLHVIVDCLRTEGRRGALFRPRHPGPRIYVLAGRQTEGEGTRDSYS